MGEPIPPSGLFSAVAAAVASWRGISPKFRITGCPEDPDRFLLDIEILNARSTPLLVSEWWVFRKQADAIRLLFVGISREHDIRSAANLWAGRSQRSEIGPRSGLRCHVSADRSTKRIFIIFGWERATWLLPCRLPKFAYLPRRRIEALIAARGNWP
jgi:hypothetical protein